MTAIFTHELRSYFHTLTAWLFAAFLLCFTGIGTMMYNIQAAVSNFEYVLSFGCLIFVVIVPLLTMRVIAEERRQKTDQLLYSLPVSTVEVVLGKYAALIALCLAPLAIIAVYPLIFAQFGDVYLPTSYGSLFAFFLLGAALLAVGMFVSSLTENQGLAAGVGIALILFNYYSVSLSEYVSTSALGSVIALVALACLVGLLLKLLTGSGSLGYWAGLALATLSAALYILSPESIEGLVPEIMSALSLFERFYVFVNGVFDLKAAVFYLSVIGFFLFLTVQSLEKRRYN